MKPAVGFTLPSAGVTPAPGDKERCGTSSLLGGFFDYQGHSQHMMLTSKDHREAAKSFVEKRAANFKGE